MTILPKTKDLALKTDTVFGLWWLVFGLINYNNMSIMLKTKDLTLKTEKVFGNCNLY